jgi:hypothetical protein
VNKPLQISPIAWLSNVVRDSAVERMENPSIVRLGAQWHKQHFSGSKKGKDFKNCNLNAEDHDQASNFLGAVFSDVRFRTPDYS